jgi:hypothetical protein
MDDPVTAAAKVIYAAGRHHHWWGFDNPYDQLDPIGLEEFNATIEQALAAANAARGPTAPGHEMKRAEPNFIARIPGRTYRAIERAVTELRRHGLTADPYEIVLERSPHGMFVLFRDPDRSRTQLGSSPNVPEFWVELDGTTEVVSSAFTK